jgi:type VI protein secretion system component Hcp
MKKPAVVLLACLALLPLRARAAADAFLCFPVPSGQGTQQLVGESTDTQYRNCFQFDEASYSALLDGGLATMRDFRFTKKFDSSSVSLRRALIDRTLLTSATLYVRPPGAAAGVTILTVRFLESRISSIAVAHDGGEVGDETVSFSAERIESAFRPLDVNGQPTGPAVFTCWDIGAGTNMPGPCP